MLVQFLEGLKARVDRARKNAHQPRHWSSGRPVPRELKDWTAEDFAEADAFGEQLVKGLLIIAIMIIGTLVGLIAVLPTL